MGCIGANALHMQHTIYASIYMELLQCFTLFVSYTLCTQGCTKSSTTLVLSSPLLIVIEMTLLVNVSIIFHVTISPHLVTWELKPPLLGFQLHLIHFNSNCYRMFF